MSKLQDLTGQRFGRLVVKSKSHRDKYGSWFWDCDCDCGGSRKIKGAALRMGNVKSCGCIVNEYKEKKAALSGPKIYEPGEIKDRIGLKYAHLTITKFLWKQKTPNNKLKIFYLCRCDCGREREVTLKVLQKNEATTCGNPSCPHRFFYKEGGSLVATSEYKIYGSMIQRCNNPKNHGYKGYGGRGIKVCDRWQGPDGFSNFYADMGPRPNKELSIERIDNDAGYSPENCKWATRQEQARNKRKRKIKEKYATSFLGERRSLQQWEKLTGIKIATIQDRIRRGWAEKCAICIPSNTRLPQLFSFLVSAGLVPPRKEIVYKKLPDIYSKNRSPYANAHNYMIVNKHNIICDRWKGKEGFKNFVDDMKEPPNGRWLGRKDITGIFEPTNCVWQTRKEFRQSTSKRKTIYLNGKYVSLSEAADQIGINLSTLESRLARGRTIEQALTDKYKDRPNGTKQYSKKSGIKFSKNFIQKIVEHYLMVLSNNTSNLAGWVAPVSLCLTVKEKYTYMLYLQSRLDLKRKKQLKEQGINEHFCSDNYVEIKNKLRELRKNNIITLTYNGETKTLAELEKITGIKRATILQRKRMGLSDYEALQEELPMGKKRYEYKGEKKTLKEWEVVTGIKRKTIKTRIQKLKWSIEKALTTPVGKGRKPKLHCS